MEYYGMRKRRNIDLSRFQHEKDTTSINWGKEGMLEQDFEYEEYETVEEDHEEKLHAKLDDSPLYLNGKPFIPKKQEVKKKTFADSHVRITTYLEQNVHQIIHMLLKQGQIDSITSVVNESIKAYLLEQYSKQNNQ